MELDDLLSRKVSSNDQATHSTEAETAFTNALYSELTRNFQSETVNEEEDELTKSLLRAVTSQNSNRAEAVKEILEKGADPNKRYGGKKRTAMHEVLRRYQPDSPVDDENVAEDLQVMQLLLLYGGNVNVKDWQGNTSVHQAIVSNVPTDICRVLFAKSSEDVFADEEFKRLYLNHAIKNVNLETYRRNLVERRVWSWPPDNRWFCTILCHVIATRPDWTAFLQSTIEETPLDFSGIVDDLLAFAATYGSSESVKFLLDNGANPNADVKCPVLLEAAICARDAKAKIKLLLNRGAVPLAGSFSNSDPSSSLCGAPSRNSADDARIIAMSFAGSNTVDAQLFHRDYEFLSPLAAEGTKLIMASARPLQMALRLSRLYKKMTDIDYFNREECQEMADKFETVAVDMMENASLTDARTALEKDILEGSVRNQQKIFISNSVVQRAVTDVWYGSRQHFSWLELLKSLLLFVVHVLIYSLAAPFVWVLTPLHRNNTSGTASSFVRVLKRLFISFPTTPMAILPYIAHSISLILFVVLMVVVIHKGSSMSHFTSTEAIMCLFLFGSVETEICQLRRLKRKRYFNFDSFKKWMDIAVVNLLTIYFLLRLVVVASDGHHQYRSHLQRAAVHLLGFIGLIACVRIMTFWQAHSILGPIQISFRRVAIDVVKFLVILAVFLFGFSVCVAAIYSSYNFYAHDTSNWAETNSSGEFTETMKGQVPPSVDGVFNCIQSLFWGLFGVIDLEEFEITGTQTTPAETIIGTFMLAIWMVAAVIALTNLLIALISTSFENVQENADQEWKYARANIVFAGFVQLIPVPFNILSIPRRYTCSPSKSKHQHVCNFDVNFLTKITWANNQLVEQLQRHYQKQISEDTATKGDVEELTSTINNVVSGINTSKECCQVDRKSIDNDLMLTMQCIREDFRRLEKHLSDRLTDLECQLAALVTRISTDKPD